MALLLGTRKALHRVIAVITRDDPRERAPGQAIHQLREQRLSGVHGRVLPGEGAGKPPSISNRHHRKSPENRYASDTSTQFVRKTPDSSGLKYDITWLQIQMFQPTSRVFP